jgi:hypothetical protein
MQKKVNIFLLVLLWPFCTATFAQKSKEVSVDVCVYTATASGIMAAIAVKKEGKRVVIVEPGKWVGGILGAGIKPIQDCPNFEAVGGTTREVMKSLGMKSPPTDPTGDDLRKAMRSISPADVRRDFLALLKTHGIDVIYDHRIQRTEKKDRKISSAIFEYAPFDNRGLPPAAATTNDALIVTASVFIDASYEGELMARSGVSFMSGRESVTDFNEENAGVREPQNITPIDPYVVPGDENSGLLPLIDTDHGRPVGAGDFYTQAYNFRYYVTSDPGNRVPFPKPDGYRPENYELVGRYVEYLVRTAGSEEELMRLLRDIFPGWMNAGEYNYQRSSLITMAPVGISQLYINGDYATKAAVWRYHQDYLSGLHEFLSTDNRVPETFRKETASLGLDRRHHPDTQGWPHQLYIRVSRRMVGSYTIHAADVYNKTTITDPVALAQYGIDTYPSRRIAIEKDGRMNVALEGKMFIGGANGPTNVPYPIPYRSIVPLKSECTNLVVPVCFSATHQGYASARMEPVFMMCGESAGVAAVQSIKEKKPVQDIDPVKYQEKLKSVGQRLSWPVSATSK